MSRTSGVLAAMKALPGAGHDGPPVRRVGQLNQVAANAKWGNPPEQSGYGPFLPRPSRTFTDGAFGPMTPDPAGPGGPAAARRRVP